MSDQITNKKVLGEKPLVTFALFAYNQEKYIKDTIIGEALSQTYSPLEIIRKIQNLYIKNGIDHIRRTEVSHNFIQCINVILSISNIIFIVSSARRLHS